MLDMNEAAYNAEVSLSFSREDYKKRDENKPGKTQRFPSLQNLLHINFNTWKMLFTGQIVEIFLWEQIGNIS